MDLDALRRSIEILNEKIRPIAEKPVAFGPDLLKNWVAPPNSVEAQQALCGAIDLYLQCEAETRQKIREMFRKNRAFAWAAALPFPADTAERLRRHLAHFSILDQYPDPRDALLWLADLRSSPFYKKVCREIAELSSEATKKLLSGR
jgi:hypothetical protein